MNNIFLNAEKIIIPIDAIIKGDPQVSSFVTVIGDTYAAFTLNENEKDIGPVKLNRSDLTSDRIKTWLLKQAGQYAEILPKEVHITEWSFWYEGQIETVIDSITLVAADGRTLRLCREGAAYPYGLLLKDSTVVG